MAESQRSNIPDQDDPDPTATRQATSTSYQEIPGEPIPGAYFSSPQVAMPSFPGVALITGAGGTGIGAAVAKAFVLSGCRHIALTDINLETLCQTRDAIKVIHPTIDVFVMSGDVSSESFVNAFIDDVSAYFSRIDYAVNCAGILGSDMVKAVDMPTEAFDLLNNVNYKGAWLCCRAQLRCMQDQKPLQAHPQQRGAIVNIASQLGIVARPRAAAYCASKAAIINMTRANAIDYSENNIRVNCVCPGVIETPMTTSSNELVEALRPAIDIAPMKRMGKPEEVADAVLFLCSSKSSFIQGHALVVDGGYTIN